jgi:hypothetical protein
VQSAEQEEFLGKAMEGAAEVLKSEICKGLKTALGEPLPGATTGHGRTRHFMVQAESSKERARATINATLIGLGPEFQDPDKAHYRLELTLYVKPAAGRPTGNVQPVRVQEDFYGAGRPGISQQALQNAVMNEFGRVARMGK